MKSVVSSRQLGNVIIHLQYNPVYETCISVDKAGILEYWTGPKTGYKFPKCISFESKLDTDLFEFAKNKTHPCGLAVSPDGKRFASLSGDRKVRVFNFRTGKLYRVLDETLQRFTELQKTVLQLPNMEFGRRYCILSNWLEFLSTYERCIDLLCVLQTSGRKGVGQNRNQLGKYHIRRIRLHYLVFDDVGRQNGESLHEPLY